MLQYRRLARLSPLRRHRAVICLVKKALRDERGSEVVEYALIAGLLFVSAIATIGCVGSKILTRWNSINTSQ